LLPASWLVAMGSIAMSSRLASLDGRGGSQGQSVAVES
jgi:hypothetical protein